MSEARRAWLAAWIDPVRAALHLSLPFADLIARIALAKVFLVSGMLKLADWHDALMLARQEYPVSWLDPIRAAQLGVTTEVAASLLLAFGLFVRPAAFALLGLCLVIQFSYLALDVHLFWAALFAGFSVFGAGPLSLDRALAKGLSRSALPFARAAIGAGEWIGKRVGPVSQLALRLWLATALAGLPVSGAFFAVRSGALLPTLLGQTAAFLLTVGLATPLVAGTLAVIGFFGGMMPAGTPSIVYGAILLVLLGLRGAGPLSIDDFLLRRIHRANVASKADPHVLILGAGFGGIACAAGLRHEKVRVTLVDRRNYHLFQPLLYQVATASLSPADIATPIRALFRDDPRVSVLCGTVGGVDAERRIVRVDDRDIPYDTLVLATGATHSYFGHQEWASHAPGLKFVEDALAIRGRILAAFEDAEATENDAERESLMTFVVCGGGPTGVELAGAIAELAHHGLEKEFRRLDPASARVILVQAGPRLLPQLPERLSVVARSSLERLGVEVRLNSRIDAIDEIGVLVGSERIASATVLWAAGVVASPAAKWIGAATDQAGRIEVMPNLSVPGLEDVFAIGDTASVKAWKGALVPGLAPAAKQQGAYVARLVRARLRGNAVPPPFSYSHQGSLATIGRQSAVVDLGWVGVSGALAWWLWGTVHILFLLSARNRISVLVGWGWSYVTYGVSARMITGDAAFRVGRRTKRTPENVGTE